MMARYPFFAFLLLLAASYCSGLKIGAFNIQVFGQTKFSKEKIVATLVQIVQRYDVVFIQEIRDSAQTVIYSFLDEVNKKGEAEYALNVSIRLGRTSSKEQYAFMYRTDRAEVLREFQFNDSANDMFEREPYSVLIKNKEGGPEFFLIGAHIKPDDAFNELNALVVAYEEAAHFFGTENGVIMGDFNADCSYLSRSKYEALLFVTDERFSWLIDSSDDTTTSGSKCAYDRIIVAGDIHEFVVPSRSKVFHFDIEYGLSWEQARDVSDHYPVEFETSLDPHAAVCGWPEKHISTLTCEELHELIKAEAAAVVRPLRRRIKELEKRIEMLEVSFVQETGNQEFSAA